MNTKLINIIQTCILVLLPMILPSCSECEEVPYIDLDQINHCPNYYTFFYHDKSTIKIISSDEDIDRYASQSIADYLAYESEKSPDTTYTKMLQDESNKNRMIAELADCIREYQVDFNKYSIAAIATPEIVDASTSTEKVCSDEINVYMIMEDPMDLHVHSYNSYLQVPKGNYKLNVKKVRPNKPF